MGVTCMPGQKYSVSQRVLILGKGVKFMGVTYASATNMGRYMVFEETATEQL